jgi:hypothetical protein
MIKEGDMVMGSTSEGVVYGMVEHIMNEGGTLGVPGSEYALESMPPENPAMSVRIFEYEENEWEATAYSIGMMYQNATVVDMDKETVNPEDYVSKQAPCWDGYVQRGMKPGANGKPVPNCVPAKKSAFEGFGKDYTKSTRIVLL